MERQIFASPARRLLASGICAAALSLGIQSALAQSIILQNSENTEILLQSDSNIQISPITGNITATPADPAACTGTTGATCDDVDVQINGFGISATSVNQGQNITVNWQGRGAWQCNGTGAGLAGTTWVTQSKNFVGPGTLATGSLDPGDYTVGLECSNGPVSDSAVPVAFTVLNANPDTPQSCIDAGRVPPGNLVQDTAIIFNSSTQTTSWAGTFGVLFPNGNNRNTEINAGSYASIAFNTGSLASGTEGIVAFNAPQFNGQINGGSKLVTISECPGYFGDEGTTSDLECRQLLQPNGNVRWIINNPTAGFRCNLQPDTDYWLNIVYTESMPADSTNVPWFCTGAGDEGSATGRCGSTIDIFF
ncbi:MAG: hypothetical protein LC637_01615 [Xanthomonadaceae bacterium]|nr:hypothetical protein [Xanthomonadaceae bacterium]